MGNKYLTFAIFATFLIISGAIYQKYYRPADIGCVSPNGTVIKLSMRSLKDQWKFDPDGVTVRKGDTVELDIFNEDSYDHGFAIESFGVNTRLFPGVHTPVQFVACKSGQYPFYCSVACGEGHYRQTGVIVVTD